MFFTLMPLRIERERARTLEALALLRKLPFSVPALLQAMAFEMGTEIGDLDSVDPYTGWRLMRDPGADPRTALTLRLMPAEMRWPQSKAFSPAMMIVASSRTGAGMRMAFMPQHIYAEYGRLRSHTPTVWAYDDRDRMVRWLACCHKSQVVGEALLRGAVKTMLKAKADALAD